MKRVTSVGLLCTALTVAPAMQAQEPAQTPSPKPQTAATSPNLVPLRLQLVLSRFQGEKKISSLPYTLWITANESERTSLRMGTRMPVPTTVAAAGSPVVSYNYQNFGTDIDCRAFSAREGGYRVIVTINNNTLFVPDEQIRKQAQFADAPAFTSFTANFALLLRDGQSGQYTSATDPVSGEVLRVEATLNVLK